MTDLYHLMPEDTPEYMAPAWAACMCWAATVPQFVEAFYEDTGETWKPPASPLDRMIDEAAGRDRAVAENFIRWANVNVWGPLEPGEVPD